MMMMQEPTGRPTNPFAMSLWSSDFQVGHGIPLPTYKVADTESVRSGHSEHSRRSNNRNPRRHPNASRHQSRSNHRSCPGTLHKEETIEVQILPQDDNWGDNTTAVTGNTSDPDPSDDEEERRHPNDNDDSENLGPCHMWFGTAVSALLSAGAFLSPVAMVALPKVSFLDWRLQKCGPECDGLLISFAFKLLILLVGTWAVFFRRPKATMPRIFVFRALVMALVLVFTFSYWLFYGVRILEQREISYQSIVVFALSLVDALLFIHYLAVVLLELRQMQPQYFLKVIRSPDGESRGYAIGQLSIQRAAVWLLERYYRDFAIYNPYLETLPTKSRKNRNTLTTGLKFYDVDGLGENGGQQGQSRAVLAASARRRDSSHNERFYEEHEYERRVHKRRARLITAAEEAFTHIKRLRNEQGAAIPMDPGEAAQAIFPSMARALQKYLRITRQQPRHTMQSILDHLALCLSHDLSAKAFLEKYLVARPVLQNDRECRPVQTWALVCDTLLSRPLAAGCVFMLRQGEVSLLATVQSLPHFNITEEIIDPKCNKFVLRLNSETSV